MSNTDYLSPQNMKVIDAYLEFRKSKDINDHTINANRVQLNRFGAFLGKKRFNDVTQDDMNIFFGTILAPIEHRNVQYRVLDFYRWLEKTSYPHITEWLPRTKKKTKPSLRGNDSDLLDRALVRYFKDYPGGNQPSKIDSVVKENGTIHLRNCNGVLAIYKLKGSRLYRVRE